MTDSPFPKWLQGEELAAPLLDLTVAPDGSIRAGGTQPAGTERSKVLALKALISQVEAGEAGLEQLPPALQAMMSAYRRAIGQCREIIQVHPQHQEYFERNIAGYEAALEGLVLMHAAVDTNDEQVLAQGLAALDSAMQDLEELVKPEAYNP